MGIRDGSNERRMRNRFGATTNVGPHPSEKVCKVRHFRFFYQTYKTGNVLATVAITTQSQWPMAIQYQKLLIGSCLSLWHAVLYLVSGGTIAGR